MGPQLDEEAASRPDRGRRSAGHGFHARGEPLVWLTGGALAVAIVMIAGLLALILWQGAATFWPHAVVKVKTVDGVHHLGEIVDSDDYTLDVGQTDLMSARMRVAAEYALDGAASVDVERHLVRTGNFDVMSTHLEWVDGFSIVESSAPGWAVVVERVEWGRFYGIPRELRLDGRATATDPAEIWQSFERLHPEVVGRRREIRRIERERIGEVNAEREEARLELKAIRMEHGLYSRAYRDGLEVFSAVEERTAARFAELRGQARRLRQENARHVLMMEISSGELHPVPLDTIVRAYPANRLDLGDKVGVYLSRWREFLTDEPREANAEGGVFPAILGTMIMTLIMTLVVVPFGVLAALYLREYARNGRVVSFARIAINNLAAVPSIVFGVFGLGFFCYILGGSIDDLFYSAELPNPTFGTGGVLWASLTLALLTLPVVIVATEEALGAVPDSMREGSYACGASKWQTIRRIVLPRAAPGIMTGTILAIARGAGEVAPLMLVGAVKLAPPPLDTQAPFLHASRSFMHLGFHIYDLGFQSPNSEAARPMVFTTTLLLILIIILLNVGAIMVRSRLRRKYMTHGFRGARG